MKHELVFGYWNGRDIGNPIRYILEYSKADYIEERYDMNKVNEWLEKKVSDPNMTAMPFPNLPYLFVRRKDGSVFRLTQSMAIMRFLANKFGLVGTTPEENSTLDMLFYQIQDIREFMRRYNMEDPTLATRLPRFKDFHQESVKLFEPFSKILGSNNFVGHPTRVTFVDFYLYEILEMQRLLNDSVFTKYPNLDHYVKRIQELPGVSEYIKSDKFVKGPFFGPWAKKFGFS